MNNRKPKPCPCGGVVYYGSALYDSAARGVVGCLRCGRSVEAMAEVLDKWDALISAEGYMPDIFIFSRTLTFNNGNVALHENGTITFHFRGMEYAYAFGSDSPDGMRITIDKEASDAIKRLFKGD